MMNRVNGREPEWTAAIAGGSEAFVGEISEITLVLKQLII
jgi:hypothetical protein